MSERGPEHTTLTRAEREMVKRLAERDGLTEDEAAERLFKTALARRVRKRTGKGPARVYAMRRKA